MSLEHTASIQIKVKHSKENIRTILENGKNMGCIFLDCDASEIECNTIDSNMATELVWLRHTNDAEYGPSVYTQYQDTYFYIWFYKSNNNDIDVHISTFVSTWKKDFESGSFGIDFQKYNLFLLNLTSGNIITHLESYTIYGDSYIVKNSQQDSKVLVEFYASDISVMYSHLIDNACILNINWYDEKMLPINSDQATNKLKSIIANCASDKITPTKGIFWYGKKDYISLKFSIYKNCTWIIEPIEPFVTIIDQITHEKYLDLKMYLLLIMELFHTVMYHKLITFRTEEELTNIEKMNE